MEIMVIFWLSPIISVLAALYFLPSIVAVARSHNNTAGIVVLNIFLGWTLLGWVGALVWSLTNPAKQQVVYIQNAQPNDQTHKS